MSDLMILVIVLLSGFASGLGLGLALMARL